MNFGVVAVVVVVGLRSSRPSSSFADCWRGRSPPRSRCICCCLSHRLLLYYVAAVVVGREIVGWIRVGVAVVECWIELAVAVVVLFEFVVYSFAS